MTITPTIIPAKKKNSNTALSVHEKFACPPRTQAHVVSFRFWHSVRNQDERPVEGLYVLQAFPLLGAHVEHELYRRRVLVWVSQVLPLFGQYVDAVMDYVPISKPLVIEQHEFGYVKPVFVQAHCA